MKMEFERIRIEPLPNHPNVWRIFRKVHGAQQLAEILVDQFGNVKRTSFGASFVSYLDEEREILSFMEQLQGKENTDGTGG